MEISGIIPEVRLKTDLIPDTTVSIHNLSYINNNNLLQRRGSVPVPGTHRPFVNCREVKLNFSFVAKNGLYFFLKGVTVSRQIIIH